MKHGYCAKRQEHTEITGLITNIKQLIKSFPVGNSLQVDDKKCFDFGIYIRSLDNAHKQYINCLIEESSSGFPDEANIFLQTYKIHKYILDHKDTPCIAEKKSKRICRKWHRSYKKMV